jgi:hypothetical protein
MNADVPPLKIWINGSNLGIEPGYEHGYVFAVQSFKNRALQFHVMLESGAHFRHVPLHWLLHQPIPLNIQTLELPLLQLWDCESYKPVVTVFSFLKGYQCDCILKDKKRIAGTYWCTVDWLPDSDAEATLLLQPDQNKCAHLILLENGQIAALPTNRVLWKDAFFIGNEPDADKKGYKTVDQIFEAEDCNKWSVAKTTTTFY